MAAAFGNAGNQIDTPMTACRMGESRPTEACAL
jgi:hypothetical protein